MRVAGAGAERVSPSSKLLRLQREICAAAGGMQSCFGAALQLPCLQQNVRDGGPKACEINHAPSCSWCEADAPAIKEHASQKILRQAGTWAHAEPKLGTGSKRNSSCLVSLQNHPSTARYGCPNAPAVLLPGRDEAACVPGALQVPGRPACCLQTCVFGAATPKSLFAAARRWWLPWRLGLYSAMGT